MFAQALESTSDRTQRLHKFPCSLYMQYWTASGGIYEYFINRVSPPACPNLLITDGFLFTSTIYDCIVSTLTFFSLFLFGQNTIVFVCLCVGVGRGWGAVGRDKRKKGFLSHYSVVPPKWLGWELVCWERETEKQTVRIDINSIYHLSRVLISLYI